MRKLIAPMLSLASSLVGWTLIAPIAVMVPKRRQWIGVFGRQDGRFLDNAKAFFLQTHQSEPTLRVVFVTERESVRRALVMGGCEALRYPSPRSIWYLMRCGAFVVDEVAWFRRWRYFLLIRTPVVQLWHGFGFKWAEMEKWKREAGKLKWISHPAIVQCRLLLYRVTGRLARYGAVAATSRFTRDHVYARMFLAEHFPITGYPRNDFALSLKGTCLELAWSNVDGVVKANLDTWRREKRRLVLVAPTFRDSGMAPMQLGQTTLQAIDTFAEANGVEFIFKFHPSERNGDYIVGRHFHVCARDSDIYPVLPHTDALVTDYSSISMDFLLVDKPLLFLIPSDDDYLQKDRQLQFDPGTMMPGPIVPDWTSLLAALMNEWASDTHAGERAALRRKAFDDLPQSEAASKLLALMREQGWVKAAPGRD